MTKLPPQSEKDDPLPTKIPRVDLVDPNSSDHVVATTQLKEKIASLQKQLSAKDAQLLAKDRQVGEKRKTKIDDFSLSLSLYLIIIFYTI